MNSQPQSFALPDFTRVMWASSRARAVWEPRIARITAAWEQIERWSVADGLRSSALQSLDPTALVDVARWAAERKLVILPLGRTGAGTHYSASSSAVVDGQPWTYRVAVTIPSVAHIWARAWAEQDSETIGALLGFPTCCRAFFARTWGAGSVDPTGQMATVMPHWDTVIEQRIAANSLLRWLGVRLTPHMPCGFNCDLSKYSGARFADVGCAHGFVEEVGWILDMLDWPIEWSALHGIAEIKTPILKIAARTDYTPGVQTIRWTGSTYPADGVSGNVFPYQRPAEVKPITLHRSFKAAFEEKPDGDVHSGTHGRLQPGGSHPPDGAAEVLRAQGPAAPSVVEHVRTLGHDDITSSSMWPRDTHLDNPGHHHDGYCWPCGVWPEEAWTDNGFSSREAMDQAHAMIIEVLAAAPPTGLALDLGCGNGLLLARIRDRFGVPAEGIEVDPIRAGRAIAGVTICVADLNHLVTSSRESVDVALISARRFEEMTPAERRAFDDWARQTYGRLLVYSYDEPRFARMEACR